MQRRRHVAPTFAGLAGACLLLALILTGCQEPSSEPPTREEAVVQPHTQPHQITFVNNCQSDSIWIGGFAGSGSNAKPVAQPNWGAGNTASWAIPPTESRSLSVPACWESGQFFARTGCTSSGSGNLSCQTGDCGGQMNCGTGGVGGDNVTVAEFTMDGGTPQGCAGDDDYDVSMVAGFNLTAQIKPSQPANGRSCGTAGTCATLPDCPWGTFVNPGSTGYKATPAGEIGTCLAPQVMAAVPLAPFSGVDVDKVGCGCPAGVGCGDGSGDGFCCSPFATSQGKNGCIQDFSPTGGCHPTDCAAIPSYDAQQICDPYGQCDAALSRNAKWPTVTVNNNSVPITDYITNIQSACASTSGIYTWAFDDLAGVPGLSGGNFTCSDPNGVVNYTVTFACP